MKNKIKTTLALLAAFCGLQLFAVTYDSGTTSDNVYSSGVSWGNFVLSKMTANSAAPGDPVVLKNVGLKLAGSTYSGCSYAVLTEAVDSPTVLAISGLKGTTLDSYHYYDFPTQPVIKKATKYRLYFYSTKPTVEIGASLPTGYESNWGVRVCKVSGGTGEMGLSKDANAWSMEIRVNVATVEPLAVWDGDFKTTTKGDFTLNANGNTVADDGSIITIGSDKKGVLIDWNSVATTSFAGKQYTVLVRYANLKSVNNIQVLSTFFGGSTGSETEAANLDRLGFLADKSGVSPAHKSYGISSAALYNNGETRNGVPCETSETTKSMAVVYDTTSGYTAYFKTADTAAFSTIYAASGLKVSGDNVYGVAIGGPRSVQTWPAATGMKIKSIAIFNASLSANDLAAYRFPSDPKNRTISINFGSGQGSVSGSYGIVPSSSWNNYSEGSFNSEAKAANVSDGSTVNVKWWSSGIYQYTSVTDNALKGYLDDGACGDGTTGAGAHIAITGIPFRYYDVIIYHATDSENYQFNPAAIKQWTAQSQCGDQSDSYDGSSRLARNDANLKFGLARNATAVIGTNVSYLKRCYSFADLDIKAGGNANTARGGIAAIQIVECDPHTSEMYHNRLAGSVTIPAGTSCGQITTPAPIKATQYTATTDLALSGSTEEISGDAKYIIGQATNTRTHSMSGWFRCDGLGEEKMLYAALAHTGTHAGYKVAVDANGAIKVGKCSKYAWNGTPLQSANGVIEANKWYYITVAVDSAKPDAATATARVFVNGAEIDFPTGTFATNLDGSRVCNALAIGAGVSAAGLYADFSAIGDAGLSASLATNPRYVAIGTDYSLDMTQSASSSTAGWSPTKTGAFTAYDALNVSVNDAVSSPVTLTFDENTDVKKIAATSAAGKELTLAKDEGKTVSASQGFDFSGANGKVTVGFDTGAAAVTAGADTVLNGAGTGALTIGTDKQATVRNWLGANLSGAGTVVYNAEAAETAVSPGAFASGFTGSIKLTQGTWTCSDNYPEARPVTLSGEHAKFVLNKQDGMGHGSNLPVFTVENGATFEVDKRDTFNRTLALKNGGKLVCKQDNNDSGRAFDFYSAATLTVDGTCSIGGLTAESTSNSGILAIRRSNFTVTVNSGAELQCYSAWSTAAGYGENFIKAGDGKMIQYRDSTCALPFVVSAGTLKFVNGGRTTTAGITLNDGMKLELSATGDGSYTLGNAISGKGHIEKQDSGTYILSGANTYEGATVVSAGTLKLTGSSIGTGNYTVKSGATLDFGTHRNATIVGTSAGTVQITLTDAEKTTLDGKGSIQPFNVSGDAFAGTVVAFDGTGAAYEVEFKYEGGKIVVTKKEGARQSPFHVTNPVSETWTEAGWTDSSSPALDVRPEDWDHKASANVTVEAGQEKALTANRVLTLGTLTLANAGTLTVSASDTNTMTADELTINNTGTLTVSGNAITTADINDSASTGATTIGFAPGAATITAGANTILNTVGTGTYTINSGKTLTVKGSGLSASQVSNSGTLVFDGGSAGMPLAVTGNANLTATLAAGAYVKNTVDGNQVHNITGQGASSFYALGKESGGVGFTEGTTFANLTLVSDCATGERVWVERSTYSNVGFLANTKFYLSGVSPTIVSLSGAGEVTRAGSETLTIACTAASDYAGASTVPFTIGTCTAVQTLSGNYTGALTVNENAQVKLTGSAVPSSIANAGTVTFDYGSGTTKTATIASNTGTIEINSGTVVLKGYRGAVTLATGAKVGYTVDINDCGEFTVPQGVDINSVELYRADGSKIDTQISGGKLTYTWEITGSACYWDYEFNEAGRTTTVGPVNTGSEGTAMTFDGDRPSTVKGKEFATNIVEVGGVPVTNILLRVPSRPWRDVSSWPTKATFMFYGTMVGKDKAYQIAFGSKNNKGNQLFFATKSVKDGSVDLCYSVNGAEPTILCTMSVANAQSANHLYAVVLKDDGNGNSVVNTYLDGVLLQPYTHTGTLTLGAGFQIASGHGGVAAGGYGRPDDSDPALMDWLRVYNVELTQKAMTEYANLYPYTSTNGKATRTVNTTVDTKWVEEGKWTQALYGGGSFPTNTPSESTEVEVTVASATSLELNLDENAKYESLKIKSDNGAALTLTKGTNEDLIVPSVPGTTTIGTDVTVDYDAIILGNVTVEAGKTLTFDLSNLDLTKVYATTNIQLTGTAILEDGATITTSNLTAVKGHEVTLDVEQGQYHLNIAVTPEPFIYTIAQGEATGKWSCWGVDLAAEPDWAAVGSGEIQKAGDGEATLEQKAGFNYTVNENGGTLKFSSVVGNAASITVNNGGTFDINGKTDTAYGITLAGGSLVNNGAKIGDNNTFTNLTLTADSTVGGLYDFRIQKAGYGATTINLGANTLTKTGTNEFMLVMTTVKGTTGGKIDVQGGNLQLNENTSFDEGLAIKIGSAGTVGIRDGKSVMVGAIVGDGGTLNNEGTMSDFTLSYTLNLTGNGSYGTITMANGFAAADIGTRLGYYTFAGSGYVHAKLSTEYHPGDKIALFNVAQGGTTGLSTLKDANGDKIDSKLYTCEKGEGVVTFKKEAAIGTQYYFTLNDAIYDAQENGTVVLLTNVVAGAIITKSIVIQGDTFEMTGSGFTVDKGKVLTIAGGFIGVNSLGEEGRYSLIGGKYKNTTWTVAGGYHYAQITEDVPSYGDYGYQVIVGSSGKTGETVYPVSGDGTAGNYTGDLAFTKAELATKGIISSVEASDAAVMKALNTEGANGYMTWQNVVLGLDNKTETAIPYPAPVQGSSTTQVSLKLGDNVKVDTASGAKVTYRVLGSTSGEPGSWSEVAGEKSYTQDQQVTLPTSGVKYYKFDVIVTPAK